VPGRIAKSGLYVILLQLVPDTARDPEFF
jgi:hypothetical protein